MPTFEDLLRYLTEPGMEDIWILLDIKVGSRIRVTNSLTDHLLQVDIDPTIIMALISKTISLVAPLSHRPWNTRIILGVWGTKYLSLAKRHLPGYSVTNIGFSTLYARGFFRHPYVSFNLLATTLSLWPIGPAFIRAAHARHRSVIVWTVNDQRMMRWAMAQRVDGIITDDPARLAAAQAEWRAGGPRDASLTLRQQGRALWFNCMALFFVVLVLQWRMRDRLDGGVGKRGSWRYKQISGRDSATAPRLT